MSGPALKTEDYGNGGGGFSSSSPPPVAYAVATLQPSTTDGSKLPPTTTTTTLPNTTMPVSSTTTSGGGGVSGTGVQIMSGPPVVGGGSGNGLPMSQQEKLGAKCCGCCCDYRRAVIVVAILFIVFTGISLIFSITAASVPGVESVDDDQIQAILDNNTIQTIIISAIGLVMAVVALFGARLYNVPMLCLVVLWFVVNYGVGVWLNIDLINSINEVYRQNGTQEIAISPFGFVLSAVITCLWVYPHVGLIVEIRNGIMNVETYPREEYSCCCTDNRNRV